MSDDSRFEFPDGGKLNLSECRGLFNYLRLVECLNTAWTDGESMYHGENGLEQTCTHLSGHFSDPKTNASIHFDSLASHSYVNDKKEMFITGILFSRGILSMQEDRDKELWYKVRRSIAEYFSDLNS